MKIKVIIILLVVMANISFANKANRAIERFDIGFYNPVEMGVKDLVFELRIGNMTKMLKDVKYFGKISEVYFEVYWASGEGERIVVKGLPKGFAEKKKQLIVIAKNKLEFVIPSKLKARYGKYKLKSKISTGGTFVQAKNIKAIESIDEIQMLFGRGGKLKKLTVIGPVGTNTANFEMTPKTWSKNKWVLDRMVVKKLAGIQKTNVTYEIQYLTLGGFGFPDTIKTKAKYELVRTSRKFQPKVVEDTLIFRNYIVNSGKALKKIRRVVD